MTKINENSNKLHWIYVAGFFIILALPVLVIPPWIFPPDFGKAIIFRSIMAIILFLFVCQLLFKNPTKTREGILTGPSQSRQKRVWSGNKTIWALISLFIVYLLASIFSVDPLFSFWGSPYRGGGFITFAFFFVFAILAFIIFKKPARNAFGIADAGGDDWKKAWIFSIFIGVLVSLVGVIQYYGLFNRIFLSVPDRPPSTMGNPDILAAYLLLLSFITLSFAIKESKKSLKVFYIFSLALFLYTILITGSRAAYFGILIGGIYFFLAYPVRKVEQSGAFDLSKKISPEKNSDNPPFGISKKEISEGELSNGAYPKKMAAIKISVIALLIAVCGIVLYANTINQYPKILENNKLFESIAPRLSIKLLTQDPRTAAWQIGLSAIEARPFLGYGPENFSVGFDRNYDPSIPNINADVSWYDRAHNIILQTASDAGILGLIAYLALFIVLFWQLQKIKSDNENKLIARGAQATLIGYFVANLFGFDTFSTYIIFFLLISYSIYLTTQNNIQNGTQINAEQKKAWWKPVLIFILFIILVIFLWQYNLVPFQINAEINKASNLADQKQCDQALSLMDKILLEHSFLDSYAAMEYISFTQTCAGFFPENNLTYIKKDMELMDETVGIRPLYTRSWLFMGSSETTLAGQEKNPVIKNNLLKQASDYFNKALQLSPKHQEIPVEQAKMELVAGDYKKMQNYSEKCVASNSGIGDCYWYLAISEIYLKNINDAKKNMQTAGDKGYDVNSAASLSELSNAYGSLSDWQDLAPIYEKLAAMNPSVVQYYSSLAFFYAKLGEYDKARQEAMIVLKLSPESKQSVGSFLNSLPLR